MKNAYLVVTDLHYAVTKEHRVNYLGEVLNILSQISDIRDRYKKDGYSVHLIFLGDVIDGAIPQDEDAMRCLNLFRYYVSLFESAYSVLGNHEENNVVSNPFWFLVASLEDKDLEKIPKALQPQAVEPILTVPATLVDGEVTFYFNHYGVPVKIPTGAGIAIGLFHQNVGSSDICKMWGTFIDVEEASCIQAYQYSFFGHMHMATGKYNLSKSHTCIGEWLGSCVGTNVVEVETLPQHCNVPAILVEDGHFISVQENLIKRSSPFEAIDYQKLNVTRATNEVISAVREMTVRVSEADSLYQRVRDATIDQHLDGLVDILLCSTEQVKYEYKMGLRQDILGESD